jgi:toxin ParE1/3/4
MSSFRLSVLARQDLQNVSVYVSEQSGEERARGLVRDIVSEFPKLSDFPGMGPARPELSRGLHSLPVAGYIIFYRRYLDGVRIVRVIHGARDMAGIFRGRKKQ